MRAAAKIRTARGFSRLGGYAALLGAVLLASSPVAGPARAFIPKSSRIASAIARANTQAGRSQALLFHLTLRIGEGEVLAKGELLTHPSGFARLELRGANGLVERHLLQGKEHTATRNGDWLPQPRPLLPPLFFAQADSGASLKAALSAFGVNPDLVGLGVCGESDCFVMGDPRRVPDRGAPPRSNSAPPARRRADKDDALLGTFAPVPSSVWIDMRSFRIQRLELAGGVVVELGPPVLNDKLETPQWVLIKEPDRPPVKLEFTQVVPMNAPARSFREDWLLTGRTEGSGPDEP